MIVGRDGVIFRWKKKAQPSFSKNSRMVSVNQPHQKVALISSGALDERDGLIILVVDGQVRMSARMA